MIVLMLTWIPHRSSNIGCWSVTMRQFWLLTDLVSTINYISGRTPIDLFNHTAMDPAGIMAMMVMSWAGLNLEIYFLPVAGT